MSAVRSLMRHGKKNADDKENSALLNEFKKYRQLLKLLESAREAAVLYESSLQNTRSTGMLLADGWQKFGTELLSLSLTKKGALGHFMVQIGQIQLQVEERRDTLAKSVHRQLVQELEAIMQRLDDFLEWEPQIHNAQKRLRDCERALLDVDSAYKLSVEQAMTLRNAAQALQSEKGSSSPSSLAPPTASSRPSSNASSTGNSATNTLRRVLSPRRKKEAAAAAAAVSNSNSSASPGVSGKSTPDRKNTPTGLSSSGQTVAPKPLPRLGSSQSDRANDLVNHSVLGIHDDHTRLYEGAYAYAEAKRDFKSKVHECWNALHTVDAELELALLGACTGAVTAHGENYSRAYTIIAEYEAYVRDCIAYAEVLRQRVLTEDLARVRRTERRRSVHVGDGGNGPLLALLAAPDLALLKSMVAQLPPNDIVRVVDDVVCIAHRNRMAVGLIKLAISEEMAQTSSQGTLFRGNTITTRLLAAFARHVGADYLKSCLGSCVKEVLETPLNFETNPRKVNADEDADGVAKLNGAHLRRVCTTLLDTIDSVSPPPVLQEIAFHLQREAIMHFGSGGEGIGVQAKSDMCVTAPSPSSETPSKESMNAMEGSGDVSLGKKGADGGGEVDADVPEESGGDVVGDNDDPSAPPPLPAKDKDDLDAEDAVDENHNHTEDVAAAADEQATGADSPRAGADSVPSTSPALSVKSTSVGGFVFLRFLCPALLSPEKYGVWEGDVKDRRSLILLSKCLQNLANGVRFRESHMIDVGMNEWLEENTQRLIAFFDRFAIEPTHPCEPHTSSEEYREAMDQTQTFIREDIERIVKSLESYNRHDVVVDLISALATLELNESV